MADEGDIIENMKYGTDLETGQTDNNVVFTGVDEDNTLMWPTDGGKVDFVAYYPWLAGGIEDFVLPVDVATQDPQRKIDLMWSNNARGQSASGDGPTLLFTHSLAKLVFNVADLGGGSLEGMTATVSGLPSTARFDLAAGRIVADSEAGDEDFEAVVATLFDADGDPDGLKEQAVVEAIALPCAEKTDYTVTFDFEGGEKAVLELTDVEYEAGKRYIYNIKFLVGDGSVRFMDSEIESITPWEDVERDDDIDVPKQGGDDDDGGGEGPTIEKGTTWKSGTLAANGQGYNISGVGGYSAGGTLGYRVNDGAATISKTDYEGGVESITIAAIRSLNGGSKISSVAVGGVKLHTANGATEMAITSTAVKNHVFTAPSGALPSGEIRITIISTSGNVIVTSFTIN